MRMPEQSLFVHFQDQKDNNSDNQDKLNENIHSVNVKLSINTSDSHEVSLPEGQIEQIEDSIMNWFSGRGIVNGNPEDAIDKARQNQRKNKRMDLSMGSLKLKKASLLIERRKLSH